MKNKSKQPLDWSEGFKFALKETTKAAIIVAVCVALALFLFSDVLLASEYGSGLPGEDMRNAILGKNWPKWVPGLMIFGFICAVIHGLFRK